MSIKTSLKRVYEKIFGEGLEMGPPSKVDDGLEMGTPTNVDDSLEFLSPSSYRSPDTNLWNEITSNSPENFVEACRAKIYSEIANGTYNQRARDLQRRFLENPETDWITNGDLDYLAKELQLKDTALLNLGPGDGSHWTVILNGDEHNFTIYDPLTTDTPENVRRVETSEILYNSACRPNIVWLSPDLNEKYYAAARGREGYNPAKYLIENKYNKFNEARQIISEFGALQSDGCNCGLYNLFFSKKLEEISLEFY